MKMLYLLPLIGFFALSFSIACQPSGNSNQNGVLVIITNRSDSTISTIKVMYTGGTYTVPLLERGESHQSYINPSSESHIELELSNDREQTVKATIDTYIDRDYSGSLTIFIDKGGQVTWDDKINVRQKYQ